ncbi:MAG: DUF3313 domain-containing protein [Candidatus Contendobacter sp.]|nr:DUF3313 domain-containing protein [Gammaproteobacteria bacterium]MCC8994675.1 DUF3313 domain-containing protein [Candidatus Contendobacter sp.]
MRSLSLLGVALLTLLASACATGPASQQPSGPAAYAAYLTYPDRLQPVPGDDGAYRWIDPSAKLAQYNRILLDPIQVQLASDADYKAIDPAQLQTLTDYFRQSIAKALGNAYPIVAKPGPEVMRVKIVITNLVPTKPEMSVVTLVVPFATVPDMASGVATGGPAGSAPYLGRTGIAAQFISSQTGQVLAEYADTEIGRKYVVDTSKGVGNAIDTGVSDYMKAYSTWAYAEKAFDKWAQQLRAWLDKTHGR